MNEKTKQPLTELEEEIKNTNKKRGDPDKETAEPAQNPQPEKLTYRAATVGLAALVLVLLAFFLGMRWIDRRAEQAALPAETVPAVNETADGFVERALPESGLVDINTATMEELMELPGIGEKKARAIVDYRNEYGPFLDITEIKEVDGIGDGIFEKIKDLIRT